MHNIEKLLTDKKTLQERVQAGLERELARQKAEGKEFIADIDIDALVDNVIKEELGDNYKESYK